MAQENIQLGLDIAQYLHTTVENYRQRDTTVPRDSKSLWRATLHRMNNDTWLAVCDMWSQLYAQHPELFKDWDIKNINTVINTVERQSHLTDSVLDQRQHKGLAWRMLMSTTELYARCEEAIRTTPVLVPNMWQQHFEEQ